MNERIKELLKQSCGFEYDEDGNELILVGKDLAKFAELIIQECLDQLHVGDTDEDYDKGAYWSREQIKNHFGVEE
jgi:hypothetical protein